LFLPTIATITLIIATATSVAYSLSAIVTPIIVINRAFALAQWAWMSWL
jgi:hypothetical protein